MSYLDRDKRLLVIDVNEHVFPGAEQAHIICRESKCTPVRASVEGPSPDRSISPPSHPSGGASFCPQPFPFQILSPASSHILHLSLYNPPQIFLHYHPYFEQCFPPARITCSKCAKLRKERPPPLGQLSKGYLCLFTWATLWGGTFCRVRVTQEFLQGANGALTHYWPAAKLAIINDLDHNWGAVEVLSGQHLWRGEEEKSKYGPQTISGESQGKE